MCPYPSLGGQPRRPGCASFYRSSAIRVTSVQFVQELGYSRRSLVQPQNCLLQVVERGKEKNVALGIVPTHVATLDSLGSAAPPT